MRDLEINSERKRTQLQKELLQLDSKFDAEREKFVAEIARSKEQLQLAQNESKQQGELLKTAEEQLDYAVGERDKVVIILNHLY